jgi:hypothetical protein
VALICLLSSCVSLVVVVVARKAGVLLSLLRHFPMFGLAASDGYEILT